MRALKLPPSHNYVPWKALEKLTEVLNFQNKHFLPGTKVFPVKLQVQLAESRCGYRGRTELNDKSSDPRDKILIFWYVALSLEAELTTVVCSYENDRIL